MRLRMGCKLEKRKSYPMDMTRQSGMLFANVADLAAAAAVADDGSDGLFDRDVDAGGGGGVEEPSLLRLLK